MSDGITCPDCGSANPPGSVACAKCNFPLVPTSAGAAAPAEAPAPKPAAAEARAFDPGPRPVRRRRERPNAMEPVQMQLWLITGVAVVLGIVYFAAQGFWKSNVKPVEGAKPEQQQEADQARSVLAKDSTNLAARIELANVLYDTGNWSEAIIHYRAAVRLDPKRPTTLVDMGVCYYNLSQFAAAESLFQQALLLDPMQPVALFNLGIVAQRRGDHQAALQYFHRSMETSPPEEMRQPLMEAMQKSMDALGKKAPPIPEASGR
jgi:cytochrome c-type biogenesis protein CcmH/NrfG